MMIDKYLNKIICADCLPTMQEISDNSVDLVNKTLYYDKRTK
jgi:DNA modification methylase